MWADLRLAWRNAARRPAFTVLVALTLALGLGVNSAVFALVDAVLLRPLPYRDPSRVVFLWQTLPRVGVPEVEATPFDYAVWRTLPAMSDVAMIQYGSFTLSGGADEPERVRGARVTASLMPLLAITPQIGRAFAPAEDLDNVPAVAILSEGLWRRRFGGDSSILGRSIEIDGTARTIVGVVRRGALPSGALTEDYQLWLPMRMSPEERVNEINHSYTIVGRLANQVTLAQATAEAEALAARLAAERPSHTETGVRLVPIGEQAVRAIRPALVVAAAGVALLVLAAAANASTLLIARASGRRQELAIRAALGATTWRLLSLSIAESLVYSALGCLAALVLGSWTLRGLMPLFAGSLPKALAVGVDARAAFFTGALSVAIGILFGVVAAYRPGPRLAVSLAAGARGIVPSRARRSRQALVVAQVALAVVLLASAGLMLSSVVKLSRVKPGFDAERILTFRMALTGPRYAAAAARTGFVSGLIERLTATNGVASAGVASVAPFGGMRNATVVDIEGRARTPGERIIIDQRHVSTGYFNTMRIPILNGRSFTTADDGRSERVTLINHAMAQRYFPNENPLNRKVRLTAGFDAGVWFRIIGIVGDVRHISLTRDPVPEMYHPIAQTAVPAFTVVVRSTADPAAVAPAARGAVQSLDAALPIYDILTMRDRIGSSFAQTRATMLVMLATALLAAALSAVAIYGSIWYAVVERMPEIGIRVALGASRGSVFRGVIGSAVVTATIGTAVGTAAAMAGGSLLRAMLFDTRTTDPLTYAAVAIGVLVLAAAAALVPAVRAMRVDPLVALRAG